MGLNKRGQEIVRLPLAGKGNMEIADSLGLTLNTIKGYKKLLPRKLWVNNRAGRKSKGNKQKIARKVFFEYLRVVMLFENSIN